jgi:hypothetical protein
MLVSKPALAGYGCRGRKDGKGVEAEFGKVEAKMESNALEKNSLNAQPRLSLASLCIEPGVQ